MPNGYEEERDRVWRASRFWGMVWQVGDTAYYLGLLASVIVPIALLTMGVLRFETWGRFLRQLGTAAVALLAGFPIGLILCAILKGVAEQGAGVRRGDPPASP